MGNACSKGAKEIEDKDIQTHFSDIGLNFSLEDWRNYHNERSIEKNLSELENIGTNLEKLQAFPKCLTRAVFICCNTYTNSDYLLGVGPTNDAITVATYMKKIGFNIYFLHNPRSTLFMKYFKNFIQKTTEYLFFYYIGHAVIESTKGDDETVGENESLVFDDTTLFDDRLIDVIINTKSETCKLCMLHDCCHSGSICNLKAKIDNGKKIPPNVMSFSSSRESEKIKQTSVGGTDQGIFTFYFFRLLSQDDTISPNKMASQIGQYLKRFQQNFAFYSTTETLLNEPIFK